MRALIRNEGETVTEKDDIEGIDWNTGAPLTGEAWYGGPYTLIENYVPEVENDLEFIKGLHEKLVEEQEEVEPVVEENEDDYVVINRVRYSKDELRSMLE